MVQLNKLQVLSKIYIRVFIIILTIIIVFDSCIPNPGSIDDAEGSGYILNIRNFSNTTYTGVKLYMGAINTQNEFKALDSLDYEDLVIKNRTDGGQVAEGNIKFSLTEPFDIYKEKLTRFSTWAPVSYEKVNEISPSNKISIKFVLKKNRKNIIKTPNGIGNVYFDILEDGTLR